jgi:hypothetical protein
MIYRVVHIALLEWKGTFVRSGASKIFNEMLKAATELWRWSWIAYKEVFERITCTLSQDARTFHGRTDENHEKSIFRSSAQPYSHTITIFLDLSILTIQWRRSQWPAARSKAWTVFSRSKAGIVGSHPTQSMDVRVCIYPVLVLFCVYVEVLRWTDPPCKESYRLWIG